MSAGFSKSFGIQVNNHILWSIKKVRRTNTPGTLRGIQKIAGKNSKKLLNKKHKKFRSGMGSLIYLLKHSRPELSNTIKELLKCLSGPNEKIKKNYRE